VGGCAGVALILGVFMISQRIDKAAGSKPALPISPPASLSPPTRRLTAVVIDGPTRQLKPADTVTLKLQGHFSDGTKSDLADSIRWLSSDNRIAVVDAQGKVTVVQPGTAEISAQQGALVSAPWMVAVKADEKIAKEIPAVKIVTLGITPARRELLTNERIALRVHGRYSDQSEKPISRDLRWLISDSTIASITAEGQLSGLRPGRVDVVVRTGEVSSAPVTIVVKELPKKPPVETPLVKAAPEIKALPPVPVVRPSLTPYIASAKSLREQGQYTAALAELARAVAIDATNSEVLKEIEQTKRACAAERSLGNRVDC